jgi:hypothetical protein
MIRHNAPYYISVIPVQAGIQFQYAVRSTQDRYRVLRTRTRLDSGLRRNDEQKNRWRA